MDDTTLNPQLADDQTQPATDVPAETPAEDAAPVSSDEPVEVKGSDLLCLATCSKCADEGARGACSKDKDHRGEHKCNRCGHTWFG